MLRKMAFKKIIIASIALLMLTIFYFFPNDSLNNFKTTVTYSKEAVIPIYLLDNNKYVARYKLNANNNNNNSLQLVDYIIKRLTISTENNAYLPHGFFAILPENTKLLNRTIENNILKIDFSKELLNIDENNEEKMIESLIYSLLEVKGVTKIMIFVEGKNLSKLPHKEKPLPILLDKSYGINKDYNINSIKQTIKTTTYYLSKYNDIYYYVPVTSISNNNKEKIEIIIEKLKSNPTYETNLISFLASRTELLKYEILENSVSLSFNNNILNLENNKISEEVKYSIGLSIRDSYNIFQTIFYVENNLMDSFNL